MSDSELDVVPKYRGNPLADFEAGVGLDLRVKLACELLKSSPIFESGGGRASSADIAAAALDISTALLDLAAARGLLYAIPEHDDLSPHLKRHIARNARASVYQHHAQQRAMRDESGGVMPAGASAFPGMHG